MGPMVHDPVTRHMVQLGMVRSGGAAARAIDGGAAPRLRQVGLALLRADLRRARRALDAPRWRGSGWLDWRDVPPHVVVLARVRAQRLRVKPTRAVCFSSASDAGPEWCEVP